ncbi:hypothetical protein LI291_08885 [Intestinibacillus massiliensis]|uniref:hypothetical protein n=1 Tax=Intestinibacillus massiliensis TaxID=1871029 RepID=UPI000B35317C|nr:hypothetical protein [Intestinibacillus massiliensis]MCB6366286.1 hypothetical protein [Intestinibacillus massiliensis]
MKKHMLKSIFAALLVASLAFSMTACGSDKKPADNASVSDSADAAAPALTDEEYEEAVAGLATEMQDVQTKLSGVDQTDAEAVKAAIEEVKKPFADLAAVTPPEKYADAHAKIKSGCEAMIAYMDGAIALTENASPSEDDVKALTDSLTTAATDLAEGQQLMADAAAK